jgi:hypothetical protein
MPSVRHRPDRMYGRAGALGGVHLATSLPQPPFDAGLCVKRTPLLLLLLSQAKAIFESPVVLQAVRTQHRCGPDSGTLHGWPCSHTIVCVLQHCYVAY